MKFNVDGDQGVLFVDDKEVKDITVFVLGEDGEEEYSLNELINTFELR